jgi:hypothetical protein
MDELLQKMLDSELLTESTQIELKEAFAAKIDDAVDAAVTVAVADAKVLAETETKAELRDEWNKERDVLVETIDAKLGEFITEEVEELKEDIAKFRDLEVESAQKLVEAKTEMTKDLESDMLELVESLDSFLEIRMSEDMSGLTQDLQEAKENTFGRKLFESAQEEFKAKFFDEAAIIEEGKDVEIKVADLEAQLTESQESYAALLRETKMTEVLEPLSGRQHTIMSAILSNVDTEKLEEGYATYVGRVLRETTDEVIEESAATDAELIEEGVIAPKEEVVLVNGDEPTLIEEGEETTTSAISVDLAELRRLAGV